MPTDLTKEVHEGFTAQGAANPYLPTSSCAEAFEVGAMLNAAEYVGPMKARAGRGASVVVDEVRYTVGYHRKGGVAGVWRAK